MPPAVASLGLALALAGSLAVGAESDWPGHARTLSSPQTVGPPPPSLDEAFKRLSAAAPSGPGSVRQASFETPAPGPASDTAPESAGPPRLAPPAGPEPGARSSESGSKPSLGGGDPIPLAPRGSSQRPADPRSKDRAGGLAPLATVAGSLGVVLGLFLVFAWAMRRTMPGAAAVLPGEVVEVLGRTALAGRAQVHLVRCGGKLLLVWVSPTDVETLTEITDPDEVNRLAGICRQAHPASATAAFRQVLQQFAGQPAPPERPGMSRGDVRRATGRARRSPEETLEDYGV
jgi:flagellar biogenesis protein FliO